MLMDKIKKLIAEELELINEELEKICITQIREDLIKFLMSPTKRIRSILALLYLKCSSQVIDKNIIDLLCATEIIHNASLLHDDVLDDANTRRGKTTLSEIYSPKVAILTGDFLISQAVEKLIKINNSQIMKIYKDCMQNMCEAEIQQFFARNSVPTEEEYISICEGKTAKLFEAVMKSCGILLKFDENIAAKIGKDFGILYQIKNDLNEISAKADRKNGIYTAKDVFGIEKTNILIDNYVEGIRREIDSLPQNIYKDGLEELLKLI